MQDRSFCHQIDSSIEAIHHLASRSRSTQLRCSECELEQFSGYAFPPKFNLVPAVLNKVLTDQTEIVLVAQVSPPSDPVNSGAVLLPSRPHLLQNPAPGTPNVSTPPPGRVSCLLQRYETEGLSKDVANLLVAATRTSTSKTHESSWRRWCRWCTIRKINPRSATLSNVLSLLADCFKESLQYRTINVLGSGSFLYSS